MLSFVSEHIQDNQFKCSRPVTASNCCSVTQFTTRTHNTSEASWVLQPLTEGDLSENVYKEQFLTRT